MKYVITVVLVLIAVLLVMRRRRKSPAKDWLAPKPLKQVDTTPDKPMAFGYKMNWLAIRADNSQNVIESPDD